MIQMIIVNTPAPYNLIGNESEEVVKRFLDQKIIEDVFTPHTDDIMRIPTGKGLYFWFMRVDGYDALSHYVPINPVDPSYEKDIDGRKYHLVYVGSAKGKTVSLRSRLKEHINQQHHEREICKGSLSTFRAGLGALISEDLILFPDSTTCEEVNNLLRDSFKLFWKSYSIDTINRIENDEKTIIKKLKPLLNIKDNPNKIIFDEPTNFYRKRRNKIYRNTRDRLKYEEEIEVNNQPCPPPTIFKHQILSERDSCIEFSVTKDQSIHAVVNGIPNLPEGTCTIKITCDNNNIDFLKFINGKIKKTKNINKYFANDDTSLGETRWRIIKREMKLCGIEEIIVKVCSK